MSFWDHLDVLKAAIVKSIAVALLFAVVMFIFKDTLFDIILAPKQSDFITYRFLNALSEKISDSSLESFSVPLINTGLAQQFMIHIKAAVCVGFLLASPYILYQIYRFLSPALYSNEKQYAFTVAGWGYVMFLIGMAVSYFLIFPLTFRFLGMYQVDSEVSNLISLDSYISTLLVMCLSIGIIFEIPVLSWLFAKLGFLSSSFMRNYRRHAIVAILIVAAVITPTADAFTLFVVALPMYLLYEASILIVARQERKIGCPPQVPENFQSAM